MKKQDIPSPNPPNLAVVLSSWLPPLYPLYVTAGNATPQTIKKLLAAYRQAQQDSVTDVARIMSGFLPAPVAHQTGADAAE
ncbi:hypothetical protein MCOR04_006185 [Pyricularia oryzae]|nr:hypothetical protein MCOR04_006185 [Pyricularia oryzae]